MTGSSFLIRVFPALIICFFGYKLRELLVAAAWFIAGYQLTSWLAPAVIRFNIVVVIIGIAIGIILAFASFRLGKVALFLIIGYMGFQLVYQALSPLWYHIALAVVVGLFLGIMVIKLYKPTIIAFTSIGGAYVAANSLFTYLSITKDEYTLICTVILSILGLICQYRLTSSE